MNSMKADLKLKESPLTIDCFDISNTQGSNTVASCVVFKNGKPYKNGYRKYIDWYINFFKNNYN